MKIENGRRVRIKVKLQVAGGEVLEESAVEYFHGSGGMLAGLEEILDGLETGAKKEGELPPEKAFGSPEHQHKKMIKRDEFPKDVELKVGAQLMAKGPAGQDVVLEVREVGDEEVETVMKHPLADKKIAYQVEVLGVTDPTPPPLPAQAVAADLEEEE